MASDRGTIKVDAYLTAYAEDYVRTQDPPIKQKDVLVLYSHSDERSVYSQYSGTLSGSSGGYGSSAGSGSEGGEGSAWSEGSTTQKQEKPDVFIVMVNSDGEPIDGKPLDENDAGSWGDESIYTDEELEWASNSFSNFSASLSSEDTTNMRVYPSAYLPGRLHGRRPPEDPLSWLDASTATATRSGSSTLSDSGGTTAYSRGGSDTGGTTAYSRERSDSASDTGGTTAYSHEGSDTGGTTAYSREESGGTTAYSRGGSDTGGTTAYSRERSDSASDTGGTTAYSREGSATAEFSQDTGSEDTEAGTMVGSEDSGPEESAELTKSWHPATPTSKNNKSSSSKSKATGGSSKKHSGPSSRTKTEHTTSIAGKTKTSKSSHSGPTSRNKTTHTTQSADVSAEQ